MKIIKQSENRIHLSDREGMETDTHCNYLNSNLPASIIEGLRAGRCTSLFLKARISTEFVHQDGKHYLFANYEYE